MKTLTTNNKGDNNMNLKELLYNEVIPKIKAEDYTSVIGEGYQAKIFDKFVCKKHRDICFKIYYVGRGYAKDEYAILEHAYKLGLCVPKPLELFEEANTFAMEKITGYNLEEIIKKGLKLHQDVIDAMTEAIKELSEVIEHGDIAPRNVMFGDIDIEQGVIIDAVPYIIDFGYSAIKVNKGPSNEGFKLIQLMKNIKGGE